MANKRKAPQISILMLLCTVQFMSLLDTSIVQVALPSIQQNIGLPSQQLQWVVTSYAVMCGGFILLGGRLGDMWGSRRMLMYGMALFTIASVFAGFAFDGTVLIFARALQGIGAAVMLPSVLALITLVYSEGHERNRALGFLGTVSAVGFTSGLILGGILADILGWRFIFFVNIPIGILILTISPRLLPESARIKQPMDIAGAVTATGGFVVFLYALTAAGSYGWYSMKTIGLVLLTLLLFSLFLIIERHTKFPLVPFSVFSQRSFVGAITASLVFGSVMGSSIFLLNLYMQNVLEYGPLTAAFAFLPQEILTMVAAGFVARLIAKAGTHWVLSAGMISFGTGLFLLSLITPANSYLVAVLPGTLFIGLGAAMVLVSGSIAATAGIPPEQQGLASGLWNTGPQIGTSLGIAILMAVIHSDSNSLANSSSTFREYQSAFAMAIIFAVVGFCIVFFLNRPTVKAKQKI